MRAPRIITALGLAAVALALTSCASLSASSSPVPTPSATASVAPASVPPVVVDELGAGAQETPVDVEVAGPAEVTYRKITIKPGAGTGLHCHYGQLIAVVSEGVFTHYAPIYPTGVHQYEAGDSIIEGAHYIHEGKNEGTEDVVLLVTYVTPEGEPLSETDLANCDH